MKLIIRSGNLIKSNLQNMDPYESGSNKQNVEILENASVLL